jgi:hypothetical protein
VDTSVREANLIVVGRIIGLSDTSPAAQSRRTREVHRIEVRETLKGNRPSQPEIAVRPTGQAWSDGESYVLFLRSLSPDNRWAEAVTQPVLPATTQNVQHVGDQIAALGFTAEPERVAWLIHASSNRPTPITEFLLMADGSFSWRHRPIRESSYRTRTGSLSVEEQRKLIEMIASESSSNIADDEGSIRFGWIDSAGALQSRSFAANDDPLVTHILDEVARLSGAGAP